MKRDPWAALAYASQQDDIALGVEAIKLIRFGSRQRGKIDLWE
jgi:hypothetical protein